MNATIEEVTTWLEQQRWFGGKGVPISKVEVLERIPIQSASEAEVEIVRVSYVLGSLETYLVLLQRMADGSLRDALEDPAVARGVLSFARDGRQVPLGSGMVRSETIGRGGELLASLPPEPAVRALGVEQSNTSLVLDERVLLKILRKLEVGLSPEVEVGRFLATHGYRSTPQLLASLTLEGPSASELALLYAFVPNQGDGWAYLTDALRKAHQPDREVLRRLERLGTRVGELHRVLASDPADPAFAPEPIHQEDLQRWSSSIVGELGVTLSKASDRFPELAERQDALTERAKALAALAPSGQKIRQHGDLHLGQALWTGDDWMVIDFEGEPTRPYAARREKHTPLRDVAGMLRSFSYAAAVAAVPPAARRRSVGAAKTAFLQGWRAAVEGTGLLPASIEDTRVMLDVLELEKTLYELRYELQMRPDWAHIPAEGLA
ncbi:MAG: phosphotransferase [Myxococcaceae bacterium]